MLHGRFQATQLAQLPYTLLHNRALKSNQHE
jgi:hypothetical protein